MKKMDLLPSINWYRNLNKNWHILSNVSPIIQDETLMIYGKNDAIPPLPNIADFVPNIEVQTLETGHWIQEEEPEALNRIILEWLKNE
ncbi:alpha/beta hydrolase [Erysipelothrix sp. D19-032]